MCMIIRTPHEGPDSSQYFVDYYKKSNVDIRK